MLFMVRIMFDWQGINSKLCKVPKAKTERLKKSLVRHMQIFAWQ